MGSPVPSSYLDPIFSGHSLCCPWSTYYCHHAPRHGTLDGVAFRVLQIQLFRRRHRASISCKAELGDTSVISLRKCLHLVHQRPYSVNPNEHSADSKSCLPQKPEQGKVLCILHSKATWLHFLPAWGLQIRAEKWRKPMFGPRELPALRTASEIYLGCSRE